jgi:hypothetical protein
LINLCPASADSLGFDAGSATRTPISWASCRVHIPSIATKHFNSFGEEIVRG